MSTPEAVLQVLSGGVPHHFCPNQHLSSSNSAFPSKSYVKCREKSGSRNIRSVKYPRVLQNCSRNRTHFLKCQCQRVDSISGTTGRDGNGAWLIDTANKPSPIHGEVNAQNVLGFEEVQNLKHEIIKDASYNSIGISVEDDAWNLLRESVVYYCGSPIGTIAAKDPSSSNVLNYDQVFIRDFIPSGIAFLLKGEYDIVRNFILHTLQLQSWEKTMDCHSPGQGLMPASFKVRSVPLDGDDSATEDVLDPDFGESVIDRVTPVDSDK